MIELPLHGKFYDKAPGALIYDIAGDTIVIDKVQNLTFTRPKPKREPVKIDGLPAPTDHVSGEEDSTMVSLDLCLPEDEDLLQLNNAVKIGTVIYHKPSIGESQRARAKKAYIVPLINGEIVMDPADWRCIPLMGPLDFSFTHVHNTANQKVWKIEAIAFPDPAIENACYTDGVEMPDLPAADFVGDPVTGSAGLTGLMVQFTDTSTGEPVKWEWKVDGAVFSTKKHPTYTFVMAGSYDISLKVTNSAGSDTELKADYIVVT